MGQALSRKDGHVGIRSLGASCLLLALASGMAACSDASSGPGDAPSDAATTTDSSDSRVDPGFGDAICGGDLVWPASSQGFSYERSGGFAAQPPADAGCSLISETYTLAASAKTLTQHGCEYTGPVDRVIHLSDAEARQIVTSLEAMRTSCRGVGCGADAPNVVLTVRGAATVVYNSDFYSGCGGGTPLSAPFIAFQSLSDFENVLRDIVTAACQSPEDGNAEAGTCVPGQPEGGVSDAGSAG